MSRENEFYDLDSLRKASVPDLERIEKEKKSSFYSGLAIGVITVLLVVCSVILGVQLQQRYNTSQVQQIAVEDSFVDSDLMNKMQTIEAMIDYYYYLDEVAPETLEEGVYRGMMYSLGDPYSEYYTQEELSELMNQTEGIYYGIGAYIGTDQESTLPKISGIIAGTPAEEAGIRADDIIYEVDGESTYGYSISEVVSRIKGAEGTHVILTIIREGEKDFLSIEVVRRKVESPTVSVEMFEDGTAYIQIVEFDDVTKGQFESALETARSSGMNGIILDLRSNPGGNLSTVVEIARMLLPKGLIVYTEDKYGKRTEYTCDGTREIEVPMVVLIDGNSASASEILAGAIKDYETGTLVGTTTYGKGIVQQIIPMEDGSALKMTISSYFTPKGNDIHGIGIEPDIEVPFDAEAYHDSDNPYDNQLQKAWEVLNEMK